MIKKGDIYKGKKVTEVVTLADGQIGIRFEDNSKDLYTGPEKQTTPTTPTKSRVVKINTTSGFVPYAGDKNPSMNPVTKEVSTNWMKSKMTKEQIEEIADRIGYPKTFPRSNAALQRWILSQPETAKIVEELHTIYGPVKAGHEDDGKWGIRWDNIIQKLDKARTAPKVDPATAAPPEAAASAPGSIKKPGAPESNFEQEDINDNYAYGYAPADFWTQDIVNTLGAFGDLNRIKKYSPWEQTYKPVTADPTFYDPTRELAANAEMLKMGLDSATQYAGPQSLASTYSSMQGRAADNAANILSKYNNLNVTVANQFETQNAQTLSDANLKNSDMKKKYYDEETIGSQQFDNAKAAARQNLRQSFIDAWTNRGQTQSMNEMYPQFQVDPNTGFTAYNGRNKSFYKTSPGNSFNEVLDTYNRMYPNDPDAAIRAARTAMGLPDSGRATR